MKLVADEILFEKRGNKNLWLFRSNLKIGFYLHLKPIFFSLQKPFDDMLNTFWLRSIPPDDERSNDVENYLEPKTINCSSRINMFYMCCINGSLVIVD